MAETIKEAAYTKISEMYETDQYIIQLDVTFTTQQKQKMWNGVLWEDPEIGI